MIKTDECTNENSFFLIHVSENIICLPNEASKEDEPFDTNGAIYKISWERIVK